MPQIHGPFVMIGDSMDDMLVKAQQKAQSIAPTKRGGVSTRFEKIGSTEDKDGNIKVWGEYTVKEED